MWVFLRCRNGFQSPLPKNTRSVWCFVKLAKIVRILLFGFHEYLNLLLYWPLSCTDKMTAVINIVTYLNWLFQHPLLTFRFLFPSFIMIFRLYYGPCQRRARCFVVVLPTRYDNIQDSAGHPSLNRITNT